jgi:hypothetical protein
MTLMFTISRAVAVLPGERSGRWRQLVRRGVCVLVLVLTGEVPSALAQEALGDGRKQAIAVPLSNDTIRLDGRLDEAAWAQAPAVTDFVQKEPVEGAAPTDSMEVRFVYDDAALYVGARMTSTAPIQAPTSRRDTGDEQAEHLLISLDTYLDRRTAFTFGVTASGVRIDYYHEGDQEFVRDRGGFDPVWIAATSVDTDGWSAEFWIPFSQLRFNESRLWGLNIKRWVPSNNEEVFWEMVPRTEQGWASRFGDLRGIEGVAPSRRVELLPYVSTSAHLVGDRDPRNPFNGGANVAGGVGLDAKMGLGSNLTLEATVNPDFGQVEADPAEVNLSAFETFFAERRPFFLEGIGILSGSVNNYFYSRRIGGRPPGRASGDFVDAPSASTILGAAKLTGRLATGTSIGVLGAVTADESARTFNSPQQFGRVRVAPQITYAAARLQQEFGPPGSTFGIMSTFVHRPLSDDDPLAALLTRNAVTLSGDSLVRLYDGEYELTASAGLSHVNGDARAIDELQRSSARYFDRPDASHLEYDPSRTSLSGVQAGLGLERRNGRRWLWDIEIGTQSPEFETNDLGRLSTADGIEASAQVEYRETVPGRFWRRYTITAESAREWNYAGERQSESMQSDLRLTWRNFWSTHVGGTLDFRTQDQRLTRGGPSMERPRGWELEADVGSNESARLRGEGAVSYGRDEDGGLTLSMQTELTMQPGSRWTLTVEPEYERRVVTQQFVDTVASRGGDASALTRYVFGRIDRAEYATQFRVNYTFNPNLTLDVYAEPFASSGRYDRIGELAVPRTRLLRQYGTDGTTLSRLPDGTPQVTDGNDTFTLRRARDFTVRSFRSNAVLRWEWRPGSTLFLVWQQDREEEETSSVRTTFGDMFRSIGGRGDNFFAVKMNFWIAP